MKISLLYWNTHRRGRNAHKLTNHGERLGGRRKTSRAGVESYRSAIHLKLFCCLFGFCFGLGLPPESG